MRTTYHTSSIAPSWLAEDASYHALLKEWMRSLMDLNGYHIIEGPFVQVDTGASTARVPVGGELLLTYCTVREFDLEVPTV